MCSVNGIKNVKYEVRTNKNHEPKVVECKFEYKDRTYTGLSICSDLDEFNFKIGADIAFGRALKVKSYKGQDKNLYPINRSEAIGIIAQAKYDKDYKGFAQEI